jgi:hypothetical protein
MSNSSVLANDAISSSVVPATEERQGGKKFRLSPRSGKNQSILKTRTSKMKEKVEVEDPSFYNRAQEKVKNWESELPEEPPSTESPRVMSDCDGGGVPNLPNASDIALSRSRKTCNSITLTEKFDIKMLHFLISKPKMRERMSEEVIRILKAIKQKTEKGNELTVTYVNSKKVSDCNDIPAVGRLTASKKISCGELKSNIRALLLKNYYEDLDMVNSQPTLLYQIFEKYEAVSSEDLKLLKHFVDNREHIYQSVIDSGLCDERGEAKKFILSLLFDHGVSGTKKIKNLTRTETYSSDEWDWNKFHTILKRGASYITSHENWSEVCDASLKGRDKNYKNDLGVKFSFVLQSLETDILLSIRDFLRETYDRHMDILLHDGGCVRIPDDSSRRLTSDMLRRVEEYVLETKGFKIGLAVKKWNSDLDDVVDEIKGRNENIVEIQAGYGSVDRNEIFVWDGVNTTLLQAVEAFVKHIHKLRIILPVSATDFESVFARKEGDNLWQNDDSFFKYIISQWGHKVVQEIIDKKTGEKTGVCIPAGDNKSIGSIVSMVKTLAPGIPRGMRKAIDVITDENVGRWFCADGYYDMVKRRFISTAEDPYATTFVRTDRLWCGDDIWNSFSEDHEDVITLREKYLSVFGKDPAVQNVHLRKFATAMAGELFKFWMMMIGSRNCGKGLIEAMFKACFGLYITVMSTPVVRHTNGDEGQRNREIITQRLYMARVAFTNESTQDRMGGLGRTEIDGLFMKKNRGGEYEESIARNHCQGEASFRVTACPVVNINDVPTVTPADALETAHLVAMPHKYEPDGKYASRLPSIITANPNIKGEFVKSEKLQWAFIWLLFSLWRPNTPPCRENHDDDRTKLMFESYFGEQINNNSKDLAHIFGRHFEVAEDGWVASEELYRTFYKAERGEFGGGTMRRSDELRYYTWLKEQGNLFPEHRKVVDKRKLRGFKGLKFRELETPEEDDAFAP